MNIKKDGNIFWYELIDNNFALCKIKTYEIKR